MVDPPGLEVAGISVAKPISAKMYNCGPEVTSFQLCRLPLWGSGGPNVCDLMGAVQQVAIVAVRRYLVGLKGFLHGLLGHNVHELECGSAHHKQQPRVDEQNEIKLVC